jgi:hypothetical protein
MKRDMDLIRRILLAAEEGAYRQLSSKDFVDDNTTEPTVAYHLQLMAEAGLIEASIAKTDQAGPVHGYITCIRWAGHDFLDAVRGEDIWRKTKDTVRKSGGSFTFDVLKAVATKLITVAVGLS